MTPRKAIFITGAAGGMGEATAARFAQAGWLLGLYDVDQAGLDALSSRLPADQCVTGLLDVTDEQAFAVAAAQFRNASGGRCDVLFNNAGIAPGGAFDQMPLGEMKRIIDINLHGVLIGIRALLPMLQSTPNALCLSTSSAVAIYGHAGRAVYSASKAAVKNLTEALGLEFGSDDIRTADILPGCIDTPMLRNALAAGNGGVFEPALLDRLPQEGPYRLIPVTDIADAAWAAYHSTERQHFYVPQDLEAIEEMSAAQARATTRDFLFRS